MKRLLRFVLGKREKVTRERPEIPFDGFTDSANDIPGVDYLNKEDLMVLNSVLDWNAFVADKSGRRFGNLAWAGKRSTPQTISDSRHAVLNDRIPLKDKKVLEIGCFEGIHTVNLCRLSKEVIAVDSRIENVVKTIVRCNFFHKKPSVFKCDVEQWDAPKEWMKADVCHHIGVLYHLKDPAGHLRVLASLISTAIFLDSHVALPTDALDEYTESGTTYKYRKYIEGGRGDVFSGMYDHAKWLLLDDIKKLLIDCGFTKIEVIEERMERNGPRVLLLAQR